MSTSKLLWRFKTPLTRRPCRVLFAGPHFQASLSFVEQRLQEKNHHLLGDQFELVHCPSVHEMQQAAPTIDVAIPFMEQFASDFLQAASRLRLIVQYGVGLEGIDMETATKLGIAVSNVPACQSGNAQATAEHAIYLTIGLLRHSNDYSRRFQTRQLGGLPIPRTLYKKRVTVVGYGAVGSMLCENYLLPMGAQVTAVRRNWPLDSNCSGTKGYGEIQRSTVLEKELPTTDILILACPLTPRTHHLVNESTISRLPKGSLIINVGRGPLVSYLAILPALKSGRIGGFASDVGISHPEKPAEPWDPQDPICQLPNVIFTPHVGGYTDFAYDKMSLCIVEAMEHVMAGRPPPVWINQDNNHESQ